jgi:hypothetical protein
MAELTPVQKAVEMFMKGSTPKEVSDTLGVPAETVRTWKSRHYKESDSETAFQELKQACETATEELKRTETALQNLETEFQDLKRASETQIQDLKRTETKFQDLKRTNETVETAFQNLKLKNSATETQFQDLKRTETDLVNETKLLRGQIDSLEKLLESASTSGSVRLSDNQRHLNDRIADLKSQLVASEKKLEKAATEEKERASEAKKQADAAVLILNKQIETERADAVKLLTKSIAEVQDKATKELEKLKKNAAKWESVELKHKREIFLRNLKFAYGIVACLVGVQGVEASLFTQLAYKDAGFTQWWVMIIGGILAIGFQGIGLFLTVNRGKKNRTITEGYDDKGKPIFKKTNGVLDMEAYYDMSTMQVLCIVDFAINCFVFFQNKNIADESIEVSARLALYSALAPLGIYFTSEVMLYILDKQEKLIA